MLHWVWTIVSFVAGIVLGAWADHKFALRRDRRKEFNELADELCLTFALLARKPDPYRRIAWDKIELLRGRLGAVDLLELDAAVENYRQATGEDNKRHDSLGGVSYGIPERVAQAAEHLTKVLRHR